VRGRIQRWGNSLALRIPKSFAADSRLGDGTPVELSLSRGALVIRAVPAPAVTLEMLLAGITPENLHHAVDTGPRVGGEAW
jgi:antitoxin MazE